MNMIFQYLDLDLNPGKRPRLDLNLNPVEDLDLNSGR